MFESTLMAWHDAHLIGERVQDYTPRIAGTKPGDWQSIYEGELSKVRAAVKALPPLLQEAGHWCFAPQGTREQTQARNRCQQRLWLRFREARDDQFLLSCEKTTRVLILVCAAAEESRHRAIDEERRPRLSHAEVAVRMGIDRSSFSRSWAAGYEALVEYLVGEALAALTEIDPLVHEINRRYRRVS